MFRSIAESYWSDSGAFWLGLADLAVKATLVLLLAAIGTRAIRWGPAAVRHAVWCIAVAALLALPMLGWVLPQWQVAVWRDAGPSVGADAGTAGLTATPQRVALEAMPTGAGMPPNDAFSDLPDEEAPAASVSSLGYSGGSRSLASSPGSESRPISPVSWVLLAWGAGGIVVLGFQLRGFIAIWLVGRQSERVTDEAWQKLLRHISQQVGLWRSVALVQSQRVEIPVTWGLLRPVVLLPEAARSWPEERRRAVLLHELSHVRRCDVLTQFAAALACMVYWWHPLVWWAAWRLRVEREEACDDQVLLSGMTPSSYASHLLEVAKSLRGGVSPFSVASAMAQRSQLRTRVTAVLEDRSRRPISRTAAGAVLLVAAATIIPLAAIRPTLSAQEPQTPVPSDQPTATQPRGNPSASDSQQTDLYGDPIPAGATLRLGTARFRHSGWDKTIAFSEDGREVITSVPGEMRFWETRSGKLLRKTQGEDIRFVCLSSGGKRGVSFGHAFDTEMKAAVISLGLWDMETGKQSPPITWSEPGSGWGPVFCVTGDGRTLIWASSGDGTLRFFDVASQQEILTHKMPAPCRAVSVSPDGRLVAVGVRETVYVWEWLAPDRQPVKLDVKFRGRPVLGVAFSPDGKKLAIGGDDRWGVRIWDLEAGRLLHRLKGPGEWLYAEELLFSADGKTLAAPACQGKAVVLWDVESGKQLRVFDAGHMGPRSLAISPDGRLLAATGFEGTVKVWEIASGKPIGSEAMGHEAQMTAAAFSPQADIGVTASNDGTVRIWDVATGRQRRVFRHDKAVRGLAISPDGRWIVSSDLGNTVRVWDAASGRQKYRLPGHGEYGGNRPLVFMPDGRRFASWGDEDLRLCIWDVSTGKVLREHAIRPSGVKTPNPGGSLGFSFKGAEFTPDGKLLVLAFRHNVYSFDVETGKEVRKLPSEQNIESSAVSPDGKRVALITIVGEPFEPKAAVQLVEMSSGKTIWRRPLADAYAGRIAFSPDGETLVVTVRRPYNDMRFLRASTGRQLHVIAGVPSVSPYHAPVFSADGRLLACPMDDPCVLIWELARESTDED